MTFNINVGFADLKDGNKKYALFIGDTVLANEVNIRIVDLNYWKKNKC